MSSTSKYNKMFHISWDQLHRDTKDLAAELTNRDFKGIIAITRGGLVPAAILARELEIRLIDTVCVASYNWQEQGDESELIKGVDGTDGEGWLIVDDLTDTGKTAHFIKKMYPKAYFVTVYIKPAGKSLVDKYIREVSQDTWILFPWDTEIQFVQPIIKKTN